MILPPRNIAMAVPFVRHLESLQDGPFALTASSSPSSTHQQRVRFVIAQVQVSFFFSSSCSISPLQASTSSLPLLTDHVMVSIHCFHCPIFDLLCARFLVLLSSAPLRPGATSRSQTLGADKVKPMLAAHDMHAAASTFEGIIFRCRLTRLLRALRFSH